MNLRKLTPVMCTCGCGRVSRVLRVPRNKVVPYSRWCREELGIEDKVTKVRWAGTLLRQRNVHAERSELEVSREKWT